MRQIEIKYQTFKDLTMILSIYSIAICHRPCHMHSVCCLEAFTKHSAQSLSVIGLKNLKEMEIKFQINKILDVHPSIDQSRFYNRNAIDKFQITSKFYH